MLKIGGEDTFERLYTAKFRNYMSKYGEFVAYERDRAGMPGDNYTSLLTTITLPY